MVKIIIDNGREITASDNLDAIKKLVELEMNSKEERKDKVNLVEQIYSNPMIKIKKLNIPNRESRNAR